MGKIIKKVRPGSRTPKQTTKIKLPEAFYTSHKTKEYNH
jgi:hypothetical protein